MYKFLTSIFLISVTFQACKDDSTPPLNTINQETQDFTVFNKNSWWVYMNTRTNELDTWKVQGNSQSIVPPSEMNEGFERIILDIQTIHHDSFQFIITSQTAKFLTKKHFGLAQDCYFENTFGFAGACDNNKIRLLSRDSINNICVRKLFDIYPEPCTTKFPLYIQWGKNKGITKMSYSNMDTLILIDSKLTQ